MELACICVTAAEAWNSPERLGNFGLRGYGIINNWQPYMYIGSMKVRKFILRNVGRFERLEVDVAPNAKNLSRVTVFIGNNGAGKSTLLQSLADSLSWLVARIRTEKGSGAPISDQSIRNGATASYVSIEVENESGESLLSPESRVASQVLQWTITRARKGRKSPFQTSLTDASKLADQYRANLTENEEASLPLVAYYPVERSVIEIPLKIRTRHTFGQIDGYDNSLSLGVDFRRFFEWFREREDTENESGISISALSNFEQTYGRDHSVWKTLSNLHASSRDRQLTAVRNAIETFMPGFSYLRIQRKPRIHMAIDKASITLNVSQLSQGEKSLMALVGDIARRLAMMNPALTNPLHGKGIVLIDEVDLHLHPRWQRTLIRQLTSTFPECQFILTTHSPLVISDSPDILCYSLEDGELAETKGLYGLDVNQVLLRAMDTDIRNEEIQMQLNALQDSLQEGNLEEAHALFDKLALELPADHIELAKAALLIRKLEIKRASNH